jgi:hypothetical protein
LRAKGFIGRYFFQWRWKFGRSREPEEVRKHEGAANIRAGAGIVDPPPHFNGTWNNIYRKLWRLSRHLYCRPNVTVCF